MTYKELFYFTGQCLALDEHPEFREQIIEMFADANLSVPEQVITEQPRVLGGSMETDKGNPQLINSSDLPPSGGLRGASFIQLCSDHLIIPAIYLKLKSHGLLTYLLCYCPLNPPKRGTWHLAKLESMFLKDHIFRVSYAETPFPILGKGWGWGL